MYINILVVNVLLCLLFCQINQTDGLQCYSCDNVEHPHECNVTTTCQPYQQCSTEEIINDYFLLSHKLGCTEPQYCPQQILFGKKKRYLRGKRRFRQTCCSNDLCNKYKITAQSFTTTAARSTTKIPTTTTTETTTNPTTPEYCSGGYNFKWHNHCYRLLKVNQTWSQGKHSCNTRHNRSLAVIETEQEHKAIVNGIRNTLKFAEPVWLGCSFDHQKGHWFWMNGVRMHRDDDRWDHKHAHSQDCMALVGDKYWSKHCTDTLYQLCKK